MTTVNELYKALEKYVKINPDMPVIIDIEDGQSLFPPCDFFLKNTLTEITLVEVQAQSNREYDNDSFDEDYIEFAYDEFTDTPEEPLIDKVNCLCITTKD